MGEGTDMHGLSSELQRTVETRRGSRYGICRSMNLLLLIKWTCSEGRQKRGGRQRNESVERIDTFGMKGARDRYGGKAVTVKLKQAEDEFGCRRSKGRGEIRIGSTGLAVFQSSNRTKCWRSKWKDMDMAAPRAGGVCNS